MTRVEGQNRIGAEGSASRRRNLLGNTGVGRVTDTGGNGVDISIVTHRLANDAQVHADREDIAELFDYLWSS